MNLSSNYLDNCIKRVAVLYGGWSHEKNFAAYPSVIRALETLKIEPVPISVNDENFTLTRLYA